MGKKFDGLTYFYKYDELLIQQNHSQYNGVLKIEIDRY